MVIGGRQSADYGVGAKGAKKILPFYSDGSFFGDGSFLGVRAFRMDGRARALTYESIELPVTNRQVPKICRIRLGSVEARPCPYQSFSS